MIFYNIIMIFVVDTKISFLTNVKEILEVFVAFNF